MRAILLTIIFFVLFSTCTSVYFSSLKKLSAKKFLASLPEEERFLLEYFFRCLIQEDAIGYNLIHAKPMSFFSYLQPKATLALSSDEITPVDRLECFIEGFNPKWAIFHKGFERWKKYEHLFSKNNIFFNFYGEERDLSFRQVVVLNKKLLLPLFDKHMSRIRKIDPSLRDSQSIFHSLLYDEKFKRKFYSSTALAGICLGYGEKNAVLFEKMVAYFTSLGLYGFTLQSLEHQRIIKDKLASLQASFSGVLQSHYSKRLLFSWGPSFRVDNTLMETQLLKEKYMQASKELVHFYSNTNSFLENTLCLLIEGDEP